VSRLAEFAPVWQFREVHRLLIEAAPERVYRAIKTVTARDIRFFRALTWLRRLGRPGPLGVLNPAPDLPLLEVATQSGFLLLADEPGREVVVGTVVIAPPGAARSVTAEQYRKLAGSGWAKATMNFLIERRGAGCLVTTETRVQATDDRTRRRFRVYWTLIYPGSTLIRRMWLRPLERRGEAFLVPRLIVPHAVDEERGRAVHPAPHSAHEVVSHAALVRPRRQLARHPAAVEPELLGVSDQMLVVQGELPLEQPIVHLPELPLCPSCLGHLGGVLRVRVQLREREVAEREPQARSHATPDLFHDGVRLTAVGTLEVAVLDQRRRRVRGALDVVAVPDWQHQHPLPVPRLAHRPSALASSVSSARSIPSAPGFTSIGET